MEKTKPSKCRKCLESPILWNILVLALAFCLLLIYIDIRIKGEVSTLKESLDCPHHHLTKNRSLIALKSFLNGKNGTIWRSKRNAQPSFTAAHLTGDKGPNVRRAGDYQSPQRGNYFHWSAGGTNSFSTIELEDTDEGTFAVIFEPGFYLVYSQVRYNGYGLHAVGHKTVRISSTYEKTLMTSITTQQLASGSTNGRPAIRTADSTFHSGIFYLLSNDKIAVKPLLNNDVLYTVGDDASFFGLWFLHD